MEPTLVTAPTGADATSGAWGDDDFGHLTKGVVAGSAQPRSVEQLQSVVREAAAGGYTLTARAGGNSQSGQSVCAGSVCLDLRELSKVDAVDTTEQRVTCEPGISWRQLLEHTRRAGLVPPVVPLNLDLSVGGTLSVGGFGSSSHRYGAAVSNVAQLAVVDGEGTLMRCSPTHQRELFDAVLGGLGRCGVIASATLTLVPARARVKTWFLAYDDLAALLEDQRTLAARAQVDHLEALCSATLHGLHLGSNARRVPLTSWSYCLQVSSGFDADAPSEDLLAGLGFRRVLHHEQTDAEEFSTRYDGRFRMMRLTGADRQPHPWLECVVPHAVAADVIPRALELLPSFLGDLHRVFRVAERDHPRSLVFPSSADLVAFAVLPIGVPPALLGDAQKALKAVEELLLSVGGKRYLSGWLEGWNSQAFEAHFGSHFGAWKRARDHYDPRHVFTSRLFETTGCH